MDYEEAEYIPESEDDVSSDSDSDSNSDNDGIEFEDSAPAKPKPKATKPKHVPKVDKTTQRLKQRMQSTVLQHDTADVGTPAMLSSNVKLFDHQKAFLHWIVQRKQMQLGGCVLADEMGLGKTLQSIAFVAHQKQSTPSAVCLVACPLSVLDGWKKEFERFAAALRVQTYAAPKEEREKLQDQLFVKNPPYDVLLTTYEYLSSDAEFLKRVHWNTVVLDEAHRLKNHKGKLFITLQSEYRFGFRLLLTGTPCQNNVSELWSLLHFLEPKVFADYDSFKQRFGQLRAESLADKKSSSANHSTDHQKLLKELHDLTRPFLLRRLKADVDLNLPEKREVVIYTGLSAMQKRYYTNILQRDSEALGAGNARALVNVIASLRKACNHPYLFPGAEPEPFSEGDHLFLNSGKFLMLDRVLRVLQKKGRRALIFSQSIGTLDILQDYLTYRQYSWERLDGSVRGQERFLAIERFSSKQTFVFLLSTRAGGVGLNLCSADTVIFMDHDWNPHVDLQAQARVHRIGQKKKVIVIRLVSSNTVEEVIEWRARSKLKLTSDIVERGNFDGDTKQHDEEEELAKTETVSSLTDMIQFGLDAWADPSTSDASNADASTPALDDITDEAVEAMVFGLKDVDSAKDQTTVGSKRLRGEQLVNKAIERTTKKKKRKVASAEPTVSPSHETKEDTAEKDGADKADASGIVPDEDAQKLKSMGVTQRDLTEDSKGASVYFFQGRDYKNVARASSPNESDEGGTDMQDTESDELQSSARRAKCRQALSAILQQAAIVKAANSPAGPSKKRTTATRAPLTPEELKQKQDDLRKAREKAKADRALKAAQRKQAMWDKHNYVSRSLILEQLHDQALNDQDEKKGLASSGAGAGVGAGVSADSTEEARINCVIGDASKPQQPTDRPLAGALILNCVDPSGDWPHGRGFFAALSALSPKCVKSYEDAGNMKDLSMGDVHVVEIDDTAAGAGSSSPNTSLWVAHLVVQQRKKNTGLSIDHAALSTALEKVQLFASLHNLAVHCPRIGARSVGFSWYAMERLLTNRLAARGVPTTVYYYKRQQAGHYHSQSAPQSPQAQTQDEVGATVKCSLDEDCLVVLDTGMDVVTKRKVRRLVALCGATAVPLEDLEELHSSSAWTKPTSILLVQDQEHPASSSVNQVNCVLGSSAVSPVKCVTSQWIADQAQLSLQ